VTYRVLLLIGVALIILLALVWTHTLPSYYVELATEGLIIALFAMSLDLLMGFAGLESLGHAAFFGIGAYTAGLLSLHDVSNALVLLAAAAGAAVVLSLVFGAVALRATGPYFLIITMALGYLPWGLAIRWRSLTGGDDGLPGVLRPDLGFGYSLDGTDQFFTFVLVVVLVCAILILLVGRSTFGQSLRGVKDSPSRMEAFGFHIWGLKYACFVIAAFFAGISGALFCFYNSFVSPNDLSLYRSAEGMVAVILGGAGTIIGPAIGAILILVLRHSIGAVTQYWGLVLGILYILVVLFAPRGIFFAVRDLFQLRQKRA
jgi:branched-chain amino acid transport system permease protein